MSIMNGVFLAVKHEAKKKLLVTTLSKAAAVRSHGSLWGGMIFEGVPIFSRYLFRHRITLSM